MSLMHEFAPFVKIMIPGEVLSGSYKVWGVMICNNQATVTFTFADQDGTTLFPSMTINAGATVNWPIPFLIQNGFQFASGAGTDNRVTLFLSNVGV